MKLYHVDVLVLVFITVVVVVVIVEGKIHFAFAGIHKLWLLSAGIAECIRII